MRRAPPPLGVGLSCLVGRPSVWEAVRGHVDFLEITPDILCRERITGARREMRFGPGLLADALAQAGDLPVVVHGVELSIGSAGGWNQAYLDILDRFWALRPFVWHSEHLGFLLSPGTGPDEQAYIGAPMPLPLTDEALDLIAPRAAALVRRYPTPFLLENGVHYFVDLPADHGRDQVDFLNALTELSGCDLLLDLFNFYCDAQNQGFDALAALDRLRLDRVVEIHVAGGVTHEGYLLDAHSGEVPAPVWELVDHVVARAPRLGGILFEILDSAVPELGAAGIVRQLERARESWSLRPKEVTTDGPR